MGYNDHDVLLALDIIPVGIRAEYGGQKYADDAPWVQDKLGDADPQSIGWVELDMEAIVALEPDLIVGVFSGMDAEEYGLLSRIAPTLARPDEYINYGVPWDVHARLIGRALGLDDKAEALVSQLEQRFQQIKADNPAFTGASAAAAWMYEGNFGAYTSQDGRGRFLTQLGFKIPKRIDELAGESFVASFSNELIELLDTDVLMWISFGDEALVKEIKEMPLRDTMRAYREGREIFPDDMTYSAFAFANLLSISYALDMLVPALIAAVDGDPATEVPENMR